MFVKNIAIALAFAIAATATPVEKRTNGEDIQQQCGNNLQASCCNSVSQQTLNFLPINIGQGCIPLNRKLLLMEHICLEIIA
jgi:hypothetical protein